MKTVKRILTICFFLFILLIIGFIGLIVYAVISDYKPQEKEVIFELSNQEKLEDTIHYNLLTWNIGYCGLDKDMDFFYDGGKQVKTTEEQTLKNLWNICKFLKKTDSINFFLLQEVDLKSKRSYYTNQYDSISKTLKSFNPYFAKNYDVFFVPVPPTSPMGKVTSGIAIFSKYKPNSSIRYAFPGEYGFPKQLFMLDRCFMVNRYSLKNEKELLIINTHNEAFDGGDIRKAQMEYLKKFITDEYKKGNYIIIGGDWNQCPPELKTEFKENKFDTIIKMDIAKDFLPSEWKWIYDNQIPSNRRVTEPYNQSLTLTTVIDFFLISPNIDALNIKTIQLNFENSDHNPVIISLKLKK